MSRYIDGLADTIAEAGALMRALYSEVKRRAIDNVEWEKAKARAAEAGEPSPPPPPRPHLFIVIDEFTGLMLPESVSPKPFDDPEMERERSLMVAENKERAEIGALAGRIAREARSADVTLMLITQKLKADDLSKVPGGSSLKNSLSRLLLGKATYGDKQSALRSPENAAELGEFVPKGRGLLETTLANGFPVQGWFDSTENLQRFLAGRREPVAEPYLDIAPFRRKPDPSMAGPAIVAVDRSSFAPESDEVIDLGEVEIGLELDDLEMDLGLTDDPAPEVVQVDAVPDPGDAGNTWTFDWEPAPGTVLIEVADPESVAVAAAEPESAPIWDVVDLWLQAAPPAVPEPEPRFVSDEF